MVLKNDMAIYCKSVIEAKDFFKECIKANIKWCSGKEILPFSDSSSMFFNVGTYYFIDDMRLTYSTEKGDSDEYDYIDFKYLQNKDKKEECKEEDNVKVYNIPKFDIHHDVVRIEVNDNKMTVYTNDGLRAFAECHPSDEFKEVIGYDIAYQRIKIARVERKIENMREELYNEERILEDMIN